MQRKKQRRVDKIQVFKGLWYKLLKKLSTFKKEEKQENKTQIYGTNSKKLCTNEENAVVQTLKSLFHGKSSKNRV